MNVEIAQRDEVVLRHANEADLPAIDHLTTIGYAPIQESFVAMLGADLYETVRPTRGRRGSSGRRSRTGASSPSIRSRCGCSRTPAGSSAT